MYNDLFTIGSFTIHTYGLLLALGILSAVFLCTYRGRKKNISEEFILNIALICLFAGLVGAKLLYYITELPAIVQNPKLLLNIGSGFVVYGGVGAGVLTGLWYCKQKKENALYIVDFMIPAVPLAQGFGRLGCFFAGCCYGIETTAWYGVHFPHMPQDVFVIPTQLLSSIGDFIIAGVLLALSRRKRFDGQILLGYMLLYGVGRFFLEYLRNDPRGAVWIFSTSQFISIFIVGVGILGYILLQRRAATDVSLNKETEK